MKTCVYGAEVTGDEWKNQFGSAVTGEDWKNPHPEDNEHSSTSIVIAAQGNDLDTEYLFRGYPSENQTIVTFSTHRVYLKSFMETLSEAFVAAENQQIDYCYDLIFQDADLAFREGRFSYVDESFNSIEIESAPIKALLAIFTVTSHAKNNLPNREKAIRRFRNRIQNETPDLIARCDNLM